MFTNLVVGLGKTFMLFFVSSRLVVLVLSKTKGKKILEQKNNSQKTTIDFNQKEKGLYFLKITNKNQTKTFKQIIN